MKKLLLFIIATFLLFPVWAKRHKHRKKQASSSQLLAVTFTHTSCFGHCPCYSIMVAPDGTITYNGIKFLDDTGIYIKKRETTVVAPIFDEVIQYRIDTCRGFYNSKAQDLPGTQFTITYSDSIKKIYVGANSGPWYFRKLANEIEPLGKKADTSGWTKK